MEYMDMDIQCPFKTEDLFSFLKEKGLGLARQESIYAILNSSTDRKGELFKVYETSRGSYEKVTPYPSEILRCALINDKNYIIVAHNHPKGVVLPSGPDLMATLNLITIGKRLNIRVVDHVVFNNSEIFSMKDSGILVNLYKVARDIILEDNKKYVQICKNIFEEIKVKYFKPSESTN